MTTEIQIVRCVAVGDGYVGKTSLLTRLTKRNFETDYAPTVFDNSSLDVNYKNKTYEIHFFDTAGQEEYKNIRTQTYDSADMILLCFAIDKLESFINVREMWIPEIQEYNKEAKFLLVGLKSDLRPGNFNNNDFVSEAYARNLALNFHIKFIECSPKKNENIEPVLYTMLDELEKGNKSCLLPPSQCCSSPISVIKRTFCFQKESAPD